MDDLARPVDGARGRRLRRSLMRFITVVLGTSYVGVALLGVLYTDARAVVLVVLAFGGTGWVVTRSIRRVVDQARPPLSYGLGVATGASLFVPFSTGVQELGTGGVYLLLVQIGMLSVLGTVWALDLDTWTEPDATAGSAPPCGDSAGRCPPRELLRTLPLDDLITEWRTTAGQAHPASTGHRHAVVRWREALLDEIERRNPTGFENWLLSGSEHHIRADSGGPATRPDDPTR